MAVSQGGKAVAAGPRPATPTAALKLLKSAMAGNPSWVRAEELAFGLKVAVFEPKVG